MTDNHRDRVVDQVVDKVTHRQSIEDDPEVVRAHAEQAVDELIDQPVQTFTALLAENQVTTELRAESRAAEDRT